ncbi:TRAP transporter small permease [Fulvimarina endophytica]|uniref:TRAP transporter small permease protein n=1 Tax=Fulvimarina endophytica TaxID=2293836 RepID=A0A371WZ91_9HYPH|nr:TRAP transporter small permease [Fulvimarina endophytica]RFC62310.1 TRAP transporter small permease [Fulvimarina endophytica]
MADTRELAEAHERIEQKDVPQDALSKLITPLGLIFSILFLLVTAFTLYEVLMRYVFNAPTNWVHETTIAMTALCFAFGGAYCLGTDRHIRVVLLYEAVSPRFRQILDVCICTVGALACALMAWAAWGLAYKAFYTPSGSFRLETSGSAWNPPTPAIVKAFLFVTLCVMTIQFALQAIGHLRRKPTDELHHGGSEHGALDV